MINEIQVVARSSDEGIAKLKEYFNWELTYFVKKGA